jgi:hypothetical protein
MLSGRQVYGGETVTDTIAQVITQPPRWEDLPVSTPAPIRRLLRRCLEKEPRSRFQSAGDVRIEIDEYLAAPATQPGGPQPIPLPRQPMWRRALPWALSTSLLVTLIVVLWRAAAPPADVHSIRVESRLGPGEELLLDENLDSALAVLSPNGQTLVYAGTRDGKRALFVRSLGALESTMLSGTEGAMQPFFSPEGRWVGFFAGGQLKKIAVTGGAAVTLAPAPDARGGTWGADDTIVYAPATTVGLSRVPASGGTPVILTKIGDKERTHRWPNFLPDGRTVAFIRQQSDGSHDDGIPVSAVFRSGPPMAAASRTSAIAMGHG